MPQPTAPPRPASHHQRVQRALEQALSDLQPTDAAMPESLQAARILLRIQMQRQRLTSDPHGRGDTRQGVRNCQPDASHSHPGHPDVGYCSNDSNASALHDDLNSHRQQRGQASAGQAFMPAVGLAALASPRGLAGALFAQARAMAYRHPIAVGLTLGSAVALGPRRLRRLALWAAPLAWRGWRMAERANRFAKYLRK